METSSTELLLLRSKLPLDLKLKYTEKRITDWYEFYGGNVYVSFSGGKDSTVLLHIARKLYPDIKAVFCDTGLEFPEIRDFVFTFKNVDIIRPKMPFTQVIKKYGWPIVSKEQAKYIKELQKGTTEYMTNKRLYEKNGSRTGMISKKWQYLINAPFKISEVCCDVMKKRPFKLYKKINGLMPIVGTMSINSSLRKQSYLKYGCNIFEEGKEQSRPMTFWTDDDVWKYLKDEKISYSKIYDMGYERTGCMFCLFGHHLDLRRGKDRVKLMSETHPTQYKYCMEKLGMKEVLDFYIKEK